MLSKIIKLEDSREYFLKADKFNNGEAIDWFMKFTIEAFKTSTNEVIKLKEKVKSLEQAKTFFPMTENKHRALLNNCVDNDRAILHRREIEEVKD